ncbi:m-AAA protease-interacting protein 1, mitochondrial isoform X2 [Octodon degus]|uniref:M-AAA protease-interacting protein 1, mitochondrial isoform X2 n=1 Tax=Octodon degus TaxID=10160 RepID=A0A6P6E708_OCTDE|nr:m-AAA protease-interacting protein 1, mitochondrial isoform X2 [Octodon degus]
MALASRLLPRQLLTRLLPGGAAGLRNPGAAPLRPLWAGLCCSCRRRLGSGAALCPRRLGLWPAPGVPASLAAGPAGPRRGYSSDGQRPAASRMIVLGFSNPVTWVRTRVLAFLIWAYFDREFSIAEFSAAARQAFAHVSKLLSQCKFDLLEELVAKEVLPILKEKVTSLPDDHRSALAADLDEIVYTSTGDISIYYDEKVPTSPARLSVEPVCSKLSWGIRMWKLSSFLVQVMNFRGSSHKE